MGHLSERMRLKRIWGDCGKTADQIQQTLLLKGAVFEKSKVMYLGSEKCDAFRAQLLKDDNVALLDCILDGVHEFTIEKNGTSRHLAQGYQGTYMPWWWQGLKPDRSNVGEAIHPHRERFGMGRDIALVYPEFVDLLVRLLGLDVWKGSTDEMQDLWPQLPFSPTDTAPIARTRETNENKISFTVEILKVANASAVLSNFGEVGGPGVFLSHCAVRSGKDALERTFDERQPQPY